jgi:hypothetical protein
VRSRIINSLSALLGSVLTPRSGSARQAPV